MSEKVPRVVVTRRAEQAPVLCAKLAAVGMTPITFPTIQLTPLSPHALCAALADFSTYDWLIFTSANAVDFFFRAAAACRDWDGDSSLPRTILSQSSPARARPAIAAVGTATAQALTWHGLQPDFVPSVFTGAALAAEIDGPAGKRILLPRAKAGGRVIVDELHARGATVIDIPLYDTVTATPTAEQMTALAQGFEAITFTSPSSVRGLLEIAAEHMPHVAPQINGAVIACIGTVTAETAREHGLTVTLTPDEYTLDGLVHSLTQHYGKLNHD